MSELIVQDFAGVSNLGGNKTAARLLKGGSWKKQRIIVIVPADFMIPAKVYLSHCTLAFPPNNGMMRMLSLGMEVGEAYSTAIEQIVMHKDLKHWEFVLTLEHDNLPPSDGVLKLLESMEAHKELSCISGLYFCKGEGGPAQIWGDPTDPQTNFRPQVPRPDTVQECCGTGMGFALWRLSMFRDQKIERPLFKTGTGSNGSHCTQDLGFWMNARKWGYRCAVDTRVKVGHMDRETGIIW